MELARVLGFFSATCTTVSFLFQAIKTIKTRQTKDISLVMYIVFVMGVAGWALYGVLLGEPPIYIANIITLIFVVIILVMKIKYK